jgi:hypothetical protein
MYLLAFRYFRQRNSDFTPSPPKRLFNKIWNKSGWKSNYIIWLILAIMFRSLFNSPFPPCLLTSPSSFYFAVLEVGYCFGECTQLRKVKSHSRHLRCCERPTLPESVFTREALSHYLHSLWWSWVEIPYGQYAVISRGKSSGERALRGLGLVW